MKEERSFMPGGVEDLLEAGAWEEFEVDCSGTWGGGGGAGKPDNVDGRIGLGASACLRWLLIFS